MGHRSLSALAARRSPTARRVGIDCRRTLLLRYAKGGEEAAVPARAYLSGIRYSIIPLLLAIQS